MGTVNDGTAVDCYCGNQLTYIMITTGLLSGSNGEAGEENCYPCMDGALAGGVAGECGNLTATTIAVYARTD